MGYINIWRAGLARTQQFTWELAVPSHGKGGKAEPWLQSSLGLQGGGGPQLQGASQPCTSSWAQTLPRRDLPAAGEERIQDKQESTQGAKRKGAMGTGMGVAPEQEQHHWASAARESSSSERTLGAGVSPSASPGTVGQMLLLPVMCRRASSHAASKSKAAGKSLSPLQEQLIWRTCERGGSRGVERGLAPSWWGMGQLPPEGQATEPAKPDPGEELAAGRGAVSTRTQHSPCPAAACPASAAPSPLRHLYSCPHPLLAEDEE